MPAAASETVGLCVGVLHAQINCWRILVRRHLAAKFCARCSLGGPGDRGGGTHGAFLQPVREAVSYRGLFTAGWFGVREKYCFRLEIYDRLR